MSNIVYTYKMDNLLKKYILLRLNQEETENMYRPTENRYSTEIKLVSKKFPQKPKSRATWLHGRRQWHPSPVLLLGKSHGWRSLEGCSPWGRWGSDTTERLHFHALEKEMATHSSILAWRIPGTGGPGRLLSLGSHRVGRDWTNLAAAADGFTGEFHQMFREQITTIFLPIHKPFPNTDFWVQVKQSQLFGSYQLLPPLWALRSWGNMRGSHPPYMLFLTINKELVCEQ